ncbi:MAG: hypothetical protein EPO24_00310 [Bacteroidetes bacterium]|nr:MAG: hypothetical protein EPO24_00310 [Bacteroidota bacterium]
MHYSCRLKSGNLPTVELLNVRYTNHCFPRHRNETCIIQVVEQGTNSFFCRGENIGQGNL